MVNVITLECSGKPEKVGLMICTAPLPTGIAKNTTVGLDKRVYLMHISFKVVLNVFCSRICYSSSSNSQCK